MSTRYGNGPQQGNGFCGYIVGQHVVCVKQPAPENVAIILARGGTANLPVPGQVYTVREVYISPTRGKTRIRLQELHDKPLPSRFGMWEPGFAPSNFRPLQKLTPEMFMSTDAPVKQGEPA